MRNSLGRLLTVTLLAGVFAAVMWYAWLGWDHEYYYVDGVAQGPYRAWQVIGCAVSLAIGSLIAYLAVRRLSAVWLITAATAIGFVIPWTIDAAKEDESGLFVVGAFFLVIGCVVGIGTLLLIAFAIESSRRTRA